MSRTALALAMEGERRRLLKEYDSAINFFTQAIDEDSGYAWAWAHRGAAKVEQFGTEFPGGKDDLDRAISLRKDSYPWAFAKLGQYWFQANNYEQAIATYNKALENNPDYAWALAHRGWAYYYLNDYDSAERDFSEAINRASNYAFAFAMRAATHGRMISKKLAEIQDMTNAREKIEAYEFVVEKYQKVTTDMLIAVRLDNTIYDPISQQVSAQAASIQHDQGIAVTSHKFSIKLLEEIQMMEDRRNQKTS